MSDLSAKVIAYLKRELAEAKAEANRVTESMGSEIMRLHGEIEQQRTRAEAAEQELRDYTAHVAQSKNEDRSKLAAISAHLAGVEVSDMLYAERGRPSLSRIAKEGSVHGRDHLARMDLAKMNKRLVDCAPALLAAAREALEP